MSIKPTTWLCTDEELNQVRLFLVGKAKPACFGDALYYQDCAAMLNGATRRRKCMFGLLRIYVDSNMDVYHCLNNDAPPLANLQTDSINQVWNSPKAKKWRLQVRTTKCPACVSGCYTDLVGWREVAKYAGFRTKKLIPIIGKSWTNNLIGSVLTLCTLLRDRGVEV